MRNRILVVVAAVLVAAVLHIGVPIAHPWHWLHLLGRKLYYLPILMAAAWFGTKATLVTTLAISGLYGVHVLRDWAGLPMVQTEALAEIASFWILAGVSTVLFGRERRAKQSLRETRQWLEAIADNTPALVYVKDREGRYLLVNRTFEKIFHITREQLTGRNAYDLVPRAAADSFCGHDRQVLDSELPLTVEEIVPQEDGAHTYIAVKFPLRDTAGTVHAVCGIDTDITERKRSSEALQRQREVLFQTEKLAAMGSLVAGVAHELNNPLSVVIGQAELLRRAAGEGPFRARADKIVESAERCARIVKNFLALVRQRPLERRPMSLDSVVKEALELLAYPLRVDNIEVALNLGGDLPILWGDPHQLHQILVNLVTNAQHAMREVGGPRRLAVTTRHDRDRGSVCLEVADNGPGIRPDVRARLFEPFFTTKPPGQGTGLGLSLCRGIVESHGGRITVDSGPDPGAVFRLELPIRTARGEETASPAEQPRPVIREKAILVVDDEPEVAALLAEMLAIDGHRVTTAPNGVVAMDRLRKGTYDLVLSDMRMPNLDGPGLYAEAKLIAMGVEGKFVFLTGDVLSTKTADFLKGTGAPTIGKPFRIGEVRGVVQRALLSSRERDGTSAGPHGAAVARGRLKQSREGGETT